MAENNLNAALYCKNLLFHFYNPGNFYGVFVCFSNIFILSPAFHSSR